METVNKFKDIVRQEIVSRGLTQERIGELIGVNKSCISKKFKGSIDFSIEEIEKILKYFFYSISISKDSHQSGREDLKKEIIKEIIFEIEEENHDLHKKQDNSSDCRERVTFERLICFKRDAIQELNKRL